MNLFLFLLQAPSEIYSIVMFKNKHAILETRMSGSLRRQEVWEERRDSKTFLLVRNSINVTQSEELSHLILGAFEDKEKAFSMRVFTTGPSPNSRGCEWPVHRIARGEGGRVENGAIVSLEAT